MGIVFKSLVGLQLCWLLIGSSQLGSRELIALLLLLLLQICRQRLVDSVQLVWLELAVVTLAVYFGLPLGLWYVLVCFDLVRKQQHLGMAAVAGCVYVFSLNVTLPTLPLLLGCAILLALILQRLDQQSSEYRSSLDQERRLRYSLEEAKQQLLRSQDEIVHISEVQERNRIAREIHDHVGHSIAGILVQMQVAEQFLDRDRDKARQAVVKCIAKLTETLEVLRHTVHNLRPAERLGLAYLQEIIDGYDYCPVEFRPSGDFATLPPRLLETASVIVKEALTNTSRHSRATKVLIEADANDKYLRLAIRDNGQGAGRIKEGLGLSGMRERVANLGGTFSASGQDGFLIVCVLYRG